MLLGFLQCTQSNPEREQAKEEISEAADAVGDAMQVEKDSLAMDLKAMQEKVDRKLETLNGKLKSASGKAKAEIQMQIDAWEETRSELAEDMEQFGDKAGDSWQDFKAKPARNSTSGTGK
ncbi:MAG: hypothetical protein IPK76_03140 [Lewinellaceae bacterium]|nr:hypothetical protein [Lewinellaceae bacterium]